MTALTSSDPEGFVAREIEARRGAGMPPFGRLAAIIVSGHDPSETHKTAQALARSAPQAAEIQVFGPAPAPLSLLRGRHRWRLLLKASRSIDVSETVRRWLDTVTPPPKVQVRADIDPYSFL
jgi:primosomal protein N' (replication factor Y)